MATVNERLQSAAIDRAVDFDRYSRSVAFRIIAILNKADAELIQALQIALSQLEPDTFTVARLEALIAAVRNINAAAYERVGKSLTDEIGSLAKVETMAQYEVFRQALPEEVLRAVALVNVSGEVAYAAALSRPFQGRLLSEWAKQVGEDRMRSIRESIRLGYVEGQTTADIVRRIRGTRALKYSDGILNASRRNIEAVVITALNHTAATAREQFYEANQSVIKALKWSATLDLRTTPQCRLRDGKLYKPVTHAPIGHSIPWGAGAGRLHWRCRSVAVPVTKSWKELGGVDLPEFSPSTRASMDGQVPAELTYAAWLKKQSAARQDEILGPTRGKLYRDGGVGFEKFYSDRGQFLTLEQLAERDMRPFRRAGVSP